jgi:hypothetical protein
MWQLDRLEKSETNHQVTWRNEPEKRKPKLHRRESLKLALTDVHTKYLL